MIEESMDFAILSSISQQAVNTMAHVPNSSLEEQEMWDNYYTSSDMIFDTGIDLTLTAVKERKRLVLEVIDLDICQGTDFLPEEDPNDG